MGPILTAAATSVCEAGLPRAVIGALVHVEVALNLIVQVVVTGSAAGAHSTGTALFHVDLGRLVIADGDLQVVAAVFAASTTRVVVRAPAQCIRGQG